MNYTEFINRSQDLYEKIFNEKVVDSIEYIIFAQGNPHPLRIKIEDELSILNSKITQWNGWTRENLARRDDLKELERMLMEFIEENIN